MKTLINKLIVISILCSFAKPVFAGPEAWGKLFGKVAGTAGAGGAGIMYMAHNHPQTLDRAIAFKRAMFGQYAPVVSGAHQVVPQSTMSEVAQTALQTQLMQHIEQSNNHLASQLNYQMYKDGAMVLIGTAVLLVGYDWWTGGRIRRTIAKAKNETIEYVGKTVSELGVQMKKLGTSLHTKIDSFRNWTASRFNRVENKLENAQAQRQRIASAINADNQTTHQMLNQVLQRLPQDNDTSENDTTMEEVE